MKHSIHNLAGCLIQATDGDLGTVQDFYFDDSRWTVRYMVVETGKWLSHRAVLISLAALDKLDTELQSMTVKLTRELVRGSPNIDTRGPIFRHQEVQLHEYYLWPQYWEGGVMGTFETMPYPMYEVPHPEEPAWPEEDHDPHLRSSDEVTGYRLHAVDGEIGHVEDFIVDDETWTLSEIVVRTRNWLPGKMVLISPDWIKSINWSEASVYIDHPRQSVLESPKFAPSKVGHAA